MFNALETPSNSNHKKIVIIIQFEVEKSIFCCTTKKCRK